MGGRVQSVELPTLPGVRLNMGASTVYGTVCNPFAAMVEAHDARHVRAKNVRVMRRGGWWSVLDAEGMPRRTGD